MFIGRGANPKLMVFIPLFKNILNYEKKNIDKAQMGSMLNSTKHLKNQYQSYSNYSKK